MLFVFTYRAAVAIAANSLLAECNGMLRFEVILKRVLIFLLSDSVLRICFSFVRPIYFKKYFIEVRKCVFSTALRC